MFVLFSPKCEIGSQMQLTRNSGSEISTWHASWILADGTFLILNYTLVDDIYNQWLWNFLWISVKVSRDILSSYLPGKAKVLIGFYGRFRTKFVQYILFECAISMNHHLKKKVLHTCWRKIHDFKLLMILQQWLTYLHGSITSIITSNETR